MARSATALPLLRAARGTRGEPRERSLGIGLRIWVALVGLLLIGPTLVVIPMSFTAAHTFQFPPNEWSLRWYRELFTSPEWLSALFTSLQIAILVGLLATVLGVMATFALDRSSSKRVGPVRSLIMAPMIVPSVVVAIAIYAQFLPMRLVGTVPGFVVAHTVLAVPFVVVAVTASLKGHDRRVETASASLGAGPLTTFRRITLPLILPGVASGFVFAFITSFDEVVVALFLQTPDLETLPVKMFEGIATDIDPTVAAASSLIVVVTTLILVVPQFVRTRRKAS